MRAIISTGGLIVIFSLLIIIHGSIISKSVRETQLSQGLESAFEYAMDTMEDEYSKINYDSEYEEICKEKLMEVFCNSLKEAVGTEGVINVKLIEADIRTGTFDIAVEQQFTYFFMKRTGKCVCERRVTFS